MLLVVVKIFWECVWFIFSFGWDMVDMWWFVRVGVRCFVWMSCVVGIIIIVFKYVVFWVICCFLSMCVFWLWCLFMIVYCLCMIVFFLENLKLFFVINVYFVFDLFYGCNCNIVLIFYFFVWFGLFGMVLVCFFLVLLYSCLNYIV